MEEKFREFFRDKTYIKIKNSLFNYKNRKEQIKKYFLKFTDLNKLKQNDFSIMDIGSGISPVSPLPKKTVYIDISPESAEIMSSWGYKAEVGNINKLKFRNNNFDVILCSEVLEHIKDYKKAKQITLKKNYRSNQTILDAAYKLIKNNDPDTLEFKLGISKNLIASKKSLVPNPQSLIPGFYLAENVEDESDYVAKQILKLSKNYKYSDFAILVRANNHSEPFVKSLARAGIPFQFLGPGTLYKQSEVKDLIAYLKVLYNLEDSPSLFRLLYMDIYSIDKRDISLLLSFSKKINLSLFQAIEIYLSSLGEKLSDNDFSIYIQYLPLLKKNSKNKFLIG